MKRIYSKQNERPDAILTADLHLTESIPISRTDDYLEAQKKKLLFLQDLQIKYDCPVLDAGDIFNHWKPSPWLLSQAYNLLPEKMITIPGNHDLPEHSLSLYHKSGLAVLEAVDKLSILQSRTITNINDCLNIHGIPYGQKIKYAMTMPGNKERQILILHEMVWPDKLPPWPGAEGISAIELLKQLHNTFDLILTGHHHTAFTVEYKGSLLVNPGPMMRSSVDKADYKPRCYLYFADTNTVEPIFYPIEIDVHDESIKQTKERNDRLDAYIERMNMEWEVGLSFQINLEAFFKQNKTSKKIQELIYENLEEKQ